MPSFVLLKANTTFIKQCRGIAVENIRTTNWCCYISENLIKINPGNNVILHKPNVSMECGKSGYDIKFSCKRCLKPGYDPGQNCSECLKPGHDPDKNCNECSSLAMTLGKIAVNASSLAMILNRTVMNA